QAFLIAFRPRPWGSRATMRDDPMSTATKTRLAEIIRKHERDILSSWMGLQLAAPTMRRDRIKEDELKEQSRRFLSLLAGSTLGDGERIDLESPSWSEMRDLVGKLARERAR